MCFVLTLFLRRSIKGLVKTAGESAAKSAGEGILSNLFRDDSDDSDDSDSSDSSQRRVS